MMDLAASTARTFLTGLAGLLASCQDRQCPLKCAGAVVEHSRRQHVASPELTWEAAVCLASF